MTEELKLERLADSRNELYTIRQWNVTIFRSLSWWIGFNVRNTKNYGISEFNSHSKFSFYILKLASGLPGMQHIGI